MRPRITFANVVSVIALFVALGGTAIATHPGGENTISTADIINGQVKTDDLGNGEVKVADVGQGAVATDEIANDQVKAADIGDGEVRTAQIATGAVRTDELANGQVQAEDLAPGVAPGASGARAWGLVASSGALVRSKNVTGVTHAPFTGVYCIDPGSGIDPDTGVMLVGEDEARNETSVASDNIAHTEWDSTPLDCPVGAMEVVSFVGDGAPESGGETDLGGFDLVPADQGFTFVIP